MAGKNEQSALEVEVAALKKQVADLKRQVASLSKGSKGSKSDPRVDKLIAYLKLNYKQKKLMEKHGL